MTEQRGGPVDESCVLTEGPWTHRFVGANGSRFHVVEAGTGPLVLFLHGFPEFWWAWHDHAARRRRRRLPGRRGRPARLRRQRQTTPRVRRLHPGRRRRRPDPRPRRTLRDAGRRRRRRADRLDGRRVPPQDGHAGWWCSARRTRCGCAPRSSPTRAASSPPPAAGAAVPAAPVRARADPRRRRRGRRAAAPLGRPGWVAGPEFAEYAARCREAMQIPQAAFCALEAYRWAFRSVLRLHGYRFVRLMQKPLVTPTLQLHGALDTASLPRTAQGSGRYVIAPYEWRLIDGVGPLPAPGGPRPGARRDPALGEVLTSPARRGHAGVRPAVRAGR